MARKFPNMPKQQGGANLLQKMQEDMLKFQEELEGREFSSTAGGGMVAATVSGKRDLLSIAIKPEAVDPDDVEMLQDLILAAVNGAMALADEASNEGMDKFKGVLGIPGL